MYTPWQRTHKKNVKIKIKKVLKFMLIFRFLIPRSLFCVSTQILTIPISFKNKEIYTFF